MATEVHRETAQILAFPRRKPASVTRLGADRSNVVELSPRLAHCDFGDGWYHDAAIEDDRKN